MKLSGCMDDIIDESNMGLLVDLYELTMCASYLEQGKDEEIATFDLFIRKLPANRSYYVFAGLAHVLQFLEGVRFPDSALQCLANEGFKDEFLEYLLNFRFTGDVSAVPEGSIVFPNEPLIRVTAPIIEAQIVETFLLNCVNLQTMIATKASRIVAAAQGRPVIDFGVRRCHGTDAGMKAARASYIAGCAGTSNVLAGCTYGIPVFGTMAHSFVQSFRDETNAFRAFVQSFPEKSTLLIDTYDTILGAHKAVNVARELKGRFRLRGVRLDSGDLATLSQKVRTILDQHDLMAVDIFASGDLDEYKIQELLQMNAPINAFGVGTRMDTSSDHPYVDVVYKLSERMKNGNAIPVMKLSEDKTTLPGRKNIYRHKDSAGMYQGDIIGLQDEALNTDPLLQPVIKHGAVIYQMPGLEEIRDATRHSLSSLPDTYKNLTHATKYPVTLSPGLQNLIEYVKHQLIS
jgi:nicotinate phosphoribosyltransferase